MTGRLQEHGMQCILHFKISIGARLALAASGSPFLSLQSQGKFGKHMFLPDSYVQIRVYD